MHDERQRGDDQHRGRSSTTEIDQSPEGSVREHAPERFGDEKRKPRPLRRTRLGPSERQRREREHADQASPHPCDREGDDQYEKQVEERPARHPRRLDVVNPRGKHDSPSGRQVENAADRLKVVAPTHGGDVCTIAVDTTVGIDAEIALADLDSHGLVVADARDELIRAGDGDSPENRRRRHLEAPAAMRSSSELVVNGVTGAVEIEPPGPRERQLVGARVGVTAALLGQRHRRAGTHQVRWESAPFVRQVRLLRIDGRHSFDTDQAQIGSRLEGPHLVGVPWTVGGGERELGDRPFVTRNDLDLPRSRTNLHAQPPIGFDASRNRRGERHGNEAGRQCEPEEHLAILAGHLEGDLCRHLQRNVVGDAAAHFDVEPTLLLLFRVALREPEPPLRIAVRKGEPRTAHIQLQQARLGRDLQ